MKRISLFLCALALFITGLSSCLGEGKNEASANAVGVYRLVGGIASNPFSPVFKSSIGDVYSQSMNSFEDGKCYWVYYTINYDDPLNTAAMVSENGYYSVTINQYQELDSYYSKPYLTDTTALLADELPLISGYEQDNCAYADGYFFMAHTIKIPEESQIDWDMSYNAGSISSTQAAADGSRYYDLFLRAKMKSATTRTEQEVGFLNAYELKNFLYSAANAEKNALGSGYMENSSTFKIRINYVSEIDAETGEMTWSSGTQDLIIASFLNVYSY